jgi:hypothetical protein
VPSSATSINDSLGHGFRWNKEIDDVNAQHGSDVPEAFVAQTPLAQLDIEDHFAVHASGVPEFLLRQVPLQTQLAYPSSHGVATLTPTL